MLEGSRQRARALVQLLNKPTAGLVRLHQDYALMAEMGGAGAMRGVARADIAKVLARRDDGEARAWTAEHLAELGAASAAAVGGGGVGGVPQSLQLLARGVGTSSSGALASLARTAKGGVSGVASGGSHVLQRAAAGATGVASGLSSGASAVLLSRPQHAHAASRGHEERR